MKGKNPTQNQRKAVQAPYCCYTHRPPPKQTTANTSTAGCPGSSGARFGQGTSREHLPISLQSHSALGQQPWYLEMLCRCLSDAKLLNNLWGIFPLEQKHTLQLTGDPAFPREAAVIYMCTQFPLFSKLFKEQPRAYNTLPQKSLIWYRGMCCVPPQSSITSSSGTGLSPLDTKQHSLSIIKILHIAANSREKQDRPTGSFLKLKHFSCSKEIGRQLDRDPHKIFPKTFLRYLIRSYKLIEGLYPHSSRAQPETSLLSIC